MSGRREIDGVCSIDGMASRQERPRWPSSSSRRDCPTAACGMNQVPRGASPVATQQKRSLVVFARQPSRASLAAGEVAAGSQ